MTIRVYRTHFIQELLAVTDEAEAEQFFYMILEANKNLKKIDLALQPDLAFSPVEVAVFEGFLEKLKQNTPIQYLLGQANFYGLTFKVTPDVLIPRPETEELVEWLITDVHKGEKTNIKILDIGTGSGCIAISLAKNLKNASITALDISPEALAIAQENTVRNQVAIDFITQNILETSTLKDQYDIIISNPPYVRELEKEEIKANVLDFEPHLALFVANDNALVFYKKIAQLAQNSLTKNGCLYFEINQYLGKETTDMLHNMGFQNIVLKQDIYGNDRMLKCSIV